MGLAGGLARAGGTTLLLAQQRLELAALDVEEELLRAGGLLAGLLAAALLAALGLAAIAALVVVAFWDTARIPALAGVAIAFASAALYAAWRVQGALQDKPPFLAALLAELARDREQLTGTAP